MPTDYTFRLSTYLTLGLSCLCIGYSEWDLLPEASLFTALVGVLLVVSFRAEGRYELSLAAANRLGLAIGLVAAAWIAYQFINKNSLIYSLPWPASLLPYIGALLTFLMPAKLFRPKHVGDWWTLQGMGLAAAALASSMTEEPLFGVFLGLYAVVGLWSLTLFFYRRSAGEIPPIPNTDPGPKPEIAAADPGRGLVARAYVGRAVAWLVLAAAFGLPLFFLTPRSNLPPLQFGKARMETGYAGDQMIDLNKTGDLRVNRDVAFTVGAAYPNGRPKEDLSPNQRWRGVAFNHYDTGRWTRVDVGSIYATGAVVQKDGYQPPDLGPGQYSLDFTSKLRTADLILSDPVAWDPSESPPVCNLGGELRPWWQNAEGAFRPSGLSPRDGDARYRQVTRPRAAPQADPPDPNLGPPFELNDPSQKVVLTPDAPRAEFGGPIVQYTQLPIGRFTDKTRNLLVELARSDARVRKALDRASNRTRFRIAPDDFEPVAQALASHLADSGQYEYTLKIRRDERSTDPIEEFLFKTKQGHCERFAAGLTVMLRSVGIPANYVLGFKGCDHEGEGQYVVRQEHAHAWVEVLVPRPAPPGFVRHRNAGAPIDGQPERVWHWLSLDPTPGGDAEPEEGWLGTARNTGTALFLNFIVGYNPERRRKTVAAVTEWAEEHGATVVGVVVLIVAGIVLRRPLRELFRARPAGPAEPWAATFGATGVGWFDEYARALTKAGHPLPPGRTPMEHAVALGDRLAQSRLTAPMAAIPVEVTTAFYQARYAGRPPTAAEAARLTGLVARLTPALSHLS